MRGELTAVVWDFDGTLVDTRAKNLNVTRAIVEVIHGRPADELPALRSLAEYEAALQRRDNWQELYRDDLGMSERQLAEAGAMWAEIQLRDSTAATVYEGIDGVLDHLSSLPQGIVSMNSNANIHRALDELRLASYFREIIGYEEVGFDRQKPQPDGLLACIDRLTGRAPGAVAYIGDHDTDIECARNANAHLRERGSGVEVIAIGAAYAPYVERSQWRATPDYLAEEASQILEFVRPLLAGRTVRESR